MILAALIVSLSVGLYFASTASFTRRETVSGMLRPSKGQARVVMPRSGVVEELAVREGSKVVRGAVLARISSDIYLPGGQSRVDVTQQLRAVERGEIQARLASSESAANAQAAELRERQATLRRQIQLSDGQLALLNEQLSIAQNRLEVALPLESRGFITAEEIRRRQSAVAASQLEIGRLQTTISNLNGEIRQIDHTLARTAADRVERQAQVRRELAALSVQTTSERVEGGWDLQAGATGTVSQLQISRGSFIEQGTAAMVIVPEDDQLIAELWVPTRAAGFLRPGQEVRLLYDAFPYQRFGAGSGTIVSVSETAVPPRELRSPVELKEPVYLVRARLSSQEHIAYGESFPLREGMMLTADIVLDRRTLLEWVLDPLYAAGRRL